MLDKMHSRGLSLARGFIVLIMPAVHTVLIYSTDAVKAGPIGVILGFLAEQPGAQLFMLQMGFFIGIGRRKNWAQVLKRVLMLLLGGYLLNFLRLVLPYWCGGLTNEFLQENKIDIEASPALQLLLVGDILQFAAIGYLSCQLIQRYLKTLFFKCLLLVALLLLSPYTWNLNTTNNPAGGLLTGLPPQSFFPFFPWACYPLSGLIIAQVLQIHHGQFRTIFWFIISALLIGSGLAIISIEPESWHNNFYRLGTGGTIFHLGVAIIWVLLFLFLVKNIRDNIFFTFLESLSNNITVIYFLQWILIIWLIPIFGFQTIGTGMCLIAIAFNTIISFGLAFMLRYIFKAWLYRRLNE